MTTTMIKLPGEKWWIELDSITNEVVGTYYRPQVVADIQAIQNTLAGYPSATQDAADVVDLLTAIAGKWTDAKRARITALINAMYQAHQGGVRQLEAAQLQARLDNLIALRDRLV